VNRVPPRVVIRIVAGVLVAAGAAPCPADVEVLVGDPRGRVAAAADPARVNQPFAVAFDRAGRMYGVEYVRGNRLFRVDPGARQVAFVAGRFHVTADGAKLLVDTATAAADVRFNGLHDVAVAADGRVYLADTFRHQIRAFEPGAGTVAVVAGTGTAGFGGDGGPAAAASFDQAYCGAAAPDGRSLLVADLQNKRLRRIDLVAGTVSTVAGNGQAGKPVDGSPPLEAPLVGPRAACQAADGTIYLVLREGNSLVEIRGNAIRTVVNAAGQSGYAGDGGPGRAARLAGPKYVALDRKGRVLIVDTENHCIRRYDPASGRIDLVAGTPPRAGTAVGRDLRSTALNRPHGCCLAPDGRLVIADSDNDRILAGPLAE
jgi:sugar lactone lactonase YvrE